MSPPEGNFRPRRAAEKTESFSIFSIGLLALAAATAYLRLRAIAWGAPFVYHPDEHFILQPALDIARTGDLNPHWFEYPSLLLYLEAALVAVVRWFTGASLESNYLINGIGPWDALPEQWPFVLGGRLLVAAAAVIGVVLLARVGERLYGAAAGLLAGAFLMSAALHHQSSHYLTTDVPAAAMVIACMAATVSRTPRWRVAGFLAGLAAGTKYTGGLVLLVPLLASLDAGRGVVDRLWRVLSGAVLGFLLSTPYSFLDVAAFLDGLQAQRRNYFAWRGQHGNLEWYVTHLYWQDLGPPLAVVAALGLGLAAVNVFLAWRRRQGMGLALAFLLPPLLYVPWLASYPSRAERNLIIILPFLCLAAANLVSRLGLLFRQRRLAAALMAAAGGLLIALSLPSLHSFDEKLRLPDNRTLALGWIRATLPRGTKIVREEYTPQIPTKEYDTQYVFSLARKPYSQYVGERVAYLVASSNVYGRSVNPPFIGGEAGQAFYEVLFGLPLVKEFPQGPETNGPTVRIYRIPLGP